MGVGEKVGNKDFKARKTFIMNEGEFFLSHVNSLQSHRNVRAFCSIPTAPTKLPPSSVFTRT